MRSQSFRIFWRLLQRQPGFSLVNILGLALGLAAVMMIGLYIKGESGYDASTPQAEDVYRVTGSLRNGSESFEGAVVSPTMAAYARENWPEVEASVRMFAQRERLIGVSGSMQQQVPNTLYADPGVMTFFGWELTEGNIEEALVPRDAVVLSAELAASLFPDGQALGHQLQVNQGATYTVSGVMKPLPRKLHVRPEALFSLNAISYAQGENWFNYNFYTYLRLKPGTNPDGLKEKFRSLVVEKFDPIVQEVYSQDLATYEAEGNYFRYGIQPLLDIHLGSQYTTELGQNVSRSRLQLFALIGLLILLIASINFINLSTARSLKRAREVGVRKVMGAGRRELILQFLGESIFLSLLSTLLAILIAELASPLFNSLAQQQISLPVYSLWFWLLVPMTGLMLGGIAGLYPAFYLSGFQPIGMLRGWSGNSKQGGQFRRPLVVVQYAISAALIMGSLVVYQQTRFLQEKDLGFAPEQVVVLEHIHTLGPKADAFAQTLKALPGVEELSHTAYLPVNGIQNNQLYWPAGEQTANRTSNLEFWEVDSGFIETFGISIREGRSFSARKIDTASIILNPKAAEVLGLGANPVGEQVETFHPSGSGSISYEVIGLMDPVHFEGFEAEIGPMAMIMGHGGQYIGLKIDAASWPGLKPRLEEAWQTFAPFNPIRYQFMDARFARFWSGTQGLGQLLLAFTILAILIACLGLFALAAYIAEQRRNEIGLRKVLGATSWQIVRLLSVSFLKLVALALLVAIPVSWLFLGDWLNGYAYRIDLWGMAPLLVLAVAGLSVGIALATISIQAWRAARLDPAVVLRNA